MGAHQFQHPSSSSSVFSLAHSQDCLSYFVPEPLSYCTLFAVICTVSPYGRLWTMDLTEAEDIKKRWQEYVEELHKKDLHDPDNHDDVITNPEPDILECEVKWALESITMNKASGDDGIPVELFQILKGDAVKLLQSISQKIWKTQQWPQDWKR